MFSKKISTLLILANLWVTTEEGLIDGVTFCISQVATLFEWFLLTAFLAAFVTALCATEKKTENIRLGIFYIHLIYITLSAYFHRSDGVSDK